MKELKIELKNVINGCDEYKNARARRKNEVFDNEKGCELIINQLDKIF